MAAGTDDDFFGMTQEQQAGGGPNSRHEMRGNINKKKKPLKAAEMDFFEEHFITEQFAEPGGERPLPENSGIKEIWERIIPVWKFEEDKLVDLMAERVIHETDDFIAFDKPYQMAYSGAPKDQAQLDRILQMLKKRVAPSIDRLHLITSLDKACSGVILFAKNRQKQLEYRSLLDDGHFYFRFRCLCKDFPKAEKMRISFPLIKVLRERNVKLCPLIGRADKREQLYHLNTDCLVVNMNSQERVCLIDAFSRRGMSNVVRSHLYYGLDCPIVGDTKYVRASPPEMNVLKTNIHRAAREALGIRKNDVKKLPMFVHLAEVHVPNTRNRESYSVVRAEVPAFFKFALKNLSLLKK